MTTENRGHNLQAWRTLLREELLPTSKIRTYKQYVTTSKLGEPF